MSQIALKNSANAVLRTQSYTYDASSKIMSHTVGGVTTDYGYDLAGQLITETRTGYSGAYTYDANGNRLTRTVNGVQEVYAYDDGDKLLDVKIGGVAVKEFEYDLAGRTKEITTSAGTTTITYDHESRAVTLTGPGMAQTNVYNGLDTRVGSTTNSVANTYLRNGAYVTAPVIKDSTATFTPGVSERRGTATTFSHSGLKNADAQTSVSQAVNATQQYDAFGNLASSTGTWQGQFGFGGGFGYQQDTTGLKLLGHRYYDSSTGRFLTRDPIKDGRNWYVYCDSDPVGAVDMDGLAYIRFNGTKVVLVSDDGVSKRIVFQGRAASGSSGSGPGDQSKAFYGPIPEGDYSVNPKHIGYNHDFFNPPGPDFSEPRHAWGNSRVAIDPLAGTKVHGRSGFFIHGGEYLGSAGCIDCGVDNDYLITLIKEYSGGVPIRVIVDYTGQKWKIPPKAKWTDVNW